MDINEFTHYVDSIMDRYNFLYKNYTKQNAVELVDRQINLLEFLKDTILFDIQKLIDKNVIIPNYMYNYFFEHISIQDVYYNSDFYTMNQLLIMDMENKIPNINVELLIDSYIKMIEYSIDSNDLNTNDKKIYFSNIEEYCIKKKLLDKYIEQIKQLKTTLAQNLAEKYINLINNELDYYNIEDIEEWLKDVFELDSDNETVVQLKNIVEKLRLNEYENKLEDCFLPDANIKIRPISEIANDILKKWSNIKKTAKPYLTAMHSLKTLDDFYGQDSGYEIVSYFLCYANGNLSTEEKALKYELMNLIKLYELRNLK